jgi:hypothetical protein
MDFDHLYFPDRSQLYYPGRQQLETRFYQSHQYLDGVRHGSHPAQRRDWRFAGHV